MFYKIFADKTGVYKNDNVEETKMASVIDELVERAKRETIIENMIAMAKRLLADGSLSLEKIASICELPIEKVRELAAEKKVTNLE